MAAVMPEDVADPAAGTDLYAAAALPHPEVNSDILYTNIRYT